MFLFAASTKPFQSLYVMLDLELLAQGGDHSIVQVRTIVCDDPLRDIVTTYEIFLDEPGYNILCNGSERGCLNPFCKIVSGH